MLRRSKHSVLKCAPVAAAWNHSVLLCASRRHIGSNIVNMSQLCEIKFARANGVNHTEPEAAYDALAGNLGLCSLKDFYRGAGQAYYSLATVLGGPCTDERPSVVLTNILEAKNAEWTKQQQQLATSPNSLSDNDQQQQQQQQQDTTNKTKQENGTSAPETFATPDDLMMYTSPDFRTNLKILNRLEVTREENDLLSPASMFVENTTTSTTAEEENNNKSNDDEKSEAASKDDIDASGELPKKGRAPPTLEGRGSDWPAAKFTSSHARFAQAEFEDEVLSGFKLTELAKSQTDKNSKDAGIIRTLLKSAALTQSNTPSSSPSSNTSNFSFLAIPILRSIFAPVLRNGLYQFGPWNANQVNAVAATTGNPFAPKSEGTSRRLYHLVAQPDEKIDAVQVESFRVVEKPETAAANSKKAEASKQAVEKAEVGTAAGATTSAEELKSPTPFLLHGNMTPDVDEAVKQQRRDEFFKDFEAIVTVNYLVQIPPSRYTNNYSYFRSRMKVGSTVKNFDRTGGGSGSKKAKAAAAAATTTTTTTAASGTDSSSAASEKLKAEADQEEHDDYLKALQEHYDGSKEAAIAAADSASRTLAVSNVYWTFRALEFVAGKLFSMPRNVLDPRALPHHMLGLSEAFPAQPCRYVKTVTFSYSHALEHWRVTNVQLNGHYIVDFDLKDWKSLNGGTIY